MSRVRVLARWGATLFALFFSATAAANSDHVDYMLQCQGCHLADGAGEPGRVPDLRNRIGAYLTVEGGREYLVRVPGAAQSVLDDARLAAVLNWMIRKFGPASVAADFEHFDAAEVQQYRAKPLIEVEAERERLLAQISAGQP